MKVTRIDIGTLRKPKRMPNGSLRADALLTRVGVFTYLNPDGTERREYRPPEEVFHRDSRESAEGAPVTDDHPGEMITTKNARSYATGALLGVPEKDDRFLRGTLVVHDDSLITKMERGKAHVSCGYTCDVDEHPGISPDGEKYDAIQRNIRYNHVAIVERGRAGAAVRVRMDAAIMTSTPAKGSGMKGKSIVQMTREVQALSKRFDAAPTASELADMAENAAKAVEAAESTAQAKEALAAAEDAADKVAAIADASEDDGDMEESDRAKAACEIAREAMKERADSNSLDRRKLDGNKGMIMSKSAIEAAAKALATEKSRADAIEAQLAEEKARADAAEGVVESLRAQVATLQATRADAAEVEQLRNAITELTGKVRASEKQRMDAESPERIRGAVKRRVVIETAARDVLGADLRLDDLSDRQVMVSVVEKLHGVRMDDKKSDEYVVGRFDTAIEGHRGYVSAVRGITEESNKVEKERLDTREARTKALRDMWKKPLPNDIHANRKEH